MEDSDEEDIATTNNNATPVKYVPSIAEQISDVVRERRKKIRAEARARRHAKKQAEECEAEEFRIAQTNKYKEMQEEVDEAEKAFGGIDLIDEMWEYDTDMSRRLDFGPMTWAADSLLDDVLGEMAGETCRLWQTPVFEGEQTRIRWVLEDRWL